MVENNDIFLTDPLGYRDDLRDALTDPDLDKVGTDGGAELDAARAAYRLAVALGHCRLFGVDAGEERDGVLPPHLALAAASELARVLRTWAELAADLGTRWDTAVDPAEADNLCAGLLGARMEAWATGLALDEAQQDCAEEGDARAAALAGAIDRVQDALDSFDTALEAQAEVLATVTGTRLLDNWRALLAAPYKEDLPWWLDGRLEETARRSGAEAVRTLPGPTAWAEARRRAGRSVEAAPTRPASSAGALAPPSEVHRAGEESPIPAVELGFDLAADEEQVPVMPATTFSWGAASGAWLAVLLVPTPLSEKEDQKPRRLRFVRCADSSPATELQGQPVWFGHMTVEPYRINSRGEIVVRLCDLRKFDVRRLRVGEPHLDDFTWQEPRAA